MMSVGDTRRLTPSHQYSCSNDGDQDADDQGAGDGARRGRAPIAEDVADCQIPQASDQEGDQPCHADQRNQAADAP